MKTAIPFAIGFLLSLAAGWWLVPRVVFRAEPQPVQFSHALHAGEKGGMSCQDCHAVADDGTFSGIPTVDKCAVCHSEPVGTTDEEKRFVEEFVKPNREVPWRVYSRQPDNAWFPHAVHVREAGLSCESCHGDHGKSDLLRVVEVNRITGYGKDLDKFAGGRRGLNMNDCVRCHDRHARATACIDCHK